MAVLQSFDPTGEELREIFSKSAAQGKQLLLLLEDVCASDMRIEVCSYARAVDSSSEILPLLESRQSLYSKTSICGVMDLSGTFEDQSPVQREQVETLLDADTKKEMAGFYAEQDLVHDRRDWHNKPFYKRWLTPYPKAGDYALS